MYRSGLSLRKEVWRIGQVVYSTISLEDLKEVATLAYHSNMRIAYHDILEKIEDWWPWHWGRDDDEEEEDEKVNPDLNPVLLVPGIGGSILNAVNEKGKKERIWVRLFAADHEFRSKLFSLYNPLTGEEEDVLLSEPGFCSYGVHRLCYLCG